MEQENFREILFNYQSNLTSEEVNEVMWAEVLDLEAGKFMLYNIPLHGYMIAPGDIIIATLENVDGEQMYVFDHITEFSGNSVIQVVVEDAANAAVVAEKLEGLGALNCAMEVINEHITLVAVPFEVDYKAVKAIIEPLATDKLLDYAEPIISDKHQDDLEEEA